MRARGRIAGVALSVAACAVVAGVPAASPAAPGGGGSGPSVTQLKQKAEKKTIKAVKRKLVGKAAGLAKPDKPLKVKVSSCKQRRKRGEIAGFTCAWKASGELPGLVPVRCKGEAKVAASASRAKADRCKNREELQAPLLSAPHDLLFGYFEDFTTVPDLWDDVARSGANIVREGITWRVLQPAPGGAPDTWDWSNFDAVYGQALAAGVRPVFTFRNAPCWAAPAPCKPNGVNPVDPAHVGDYAAAAAQIALRYPQAAAIEIWFEPNSAEFWGAPADPRAFSSLVGAAAAAVHATGTGVGVYSGGLAPGGADPAKIESGKFLAQALDAGGVEGADAIGFHAVTDVPFKPGDDPTQGYLGRLRIQVQSLNTALADHGVSKPIAITQLSYSSAPGEYTEAQQAEALVTSYEVLRRIADIPTVIVARLLDNGDGSKVQGFGVLHSDRSPKPAYCGLAAARGVPTPPGC